MCSVCSRCSTWPPCYVFDPRSPPPPFHDPHTTLTQNHKWCVPPLPFPLPVLLQADWNIVKRGWDAHVLGKAPHTFTDAVTAIKTLRVRG